MSFVYTIEPATRGKVLLKTTAGDIEIELWPKEAPKAVRNFVQLCLEGYYNSTIFHRIIPKFSVQGGDPTGTGDGGESIYGHPFEDEFHSRLRFSHRGILAMVNPTPIINLASTGLDTNKSQFFFTLDKCEQLNKQNTIFGKIVGDTIFNLLKISEVEIDEFEKPVYPIKITSCQVIFNPFEDIIPRELVPIPIKSKQIVKNEVLTLKKDKKLLSFGNEEEENEGEGVVFKSRIKSSHDIHNHDGKFSRNVAVDIQDLKNEPEIPVKQRKERKRDEAIQLNRPIVPVFSSESSESESEQENESKTNQTELFKKIETMKRDIQNLDQQSNPIPITRTQSSIETIRQDFNGKQRAIYGKRRKVDESTLLKSLESFKSKIYSIPVSNHSIDEENQVKCKLHGLVECKSCGVDEDEDEDDGDWIGHRLVFRKESANVYAPKLDDYLFIDPRIEAQGKNQNELLKGNKRP